MNQFDNSEYIEAKTRLTIAKAEREEIKLAQEKGDLLLREDVNQAWAEKVNIVKTKLLAIPELSPQIASEGVTVAGIKAILKRKIYEILNELADQDNGFMESPA